MTESLTDVCAQLSLLLQPAGPTVRDESWSEPFVFIPDTLYVWPGPDDEHRQHGDGLQDEERFSVTAGYAMADLGERADKVRRQDVSTALDAKAHEYAGILRANRRYPLLSDQANALWANLDAVIHHDAIRTVGTNAVRGFTITIRAWRLVGP